MLQDIAIMCGGQAIFEDLGIQLENVQLTDLGRVKKIVIDKDNTTIIEGAGKTADIKARIDQIRKELRRLDQRLRPREARRADREALRRRGPDQRRGRDRKRNEGEEGPRRRRPARHPCGRRRRHPARRRRRPAARFDRRRSPATSTTTTQVGYNIIRPRLPCPADADRRQRRRRRRRDLREGLAR